MKKPQVSPWGVLRFDKEIRRVAGRRSAMLLSPGDDTLGSLVVLAAEGAADERDAHRGHGDRSGSHQDDAARLYADNACSSCGSAYTSSNSSTVHLCISPNKWLRIVRGYAT